MFSGNLVTSAAVEQWERLSQLVSIRNGIIFHENDLIIHGEVASIVVDNTACSCRPPMVTISFPRGLKELTMPARQHRTLSISFSPEKVNLSRDGGTWSFTFSSQHFFEGKKFDVTITTERIPEYVSRTEMISRINQGKGEVWMLLTDNTGNYRTKLNTVSEAGGFLKVSGAGSEKLADCGGWKPLINQGLVFTSYIQGPIEVREKVFSFLVPAYTINEQNYANQANIFIEIKA